MPTVEEPISPDNPLPEMERAIIIEEATVGSIRVAPNGVDEGQESVVIETPMATYFYHKEGAGFSSLLDADGRDWIGYAPGNGPAGEYRGIPNMVFRGSERGFFHPGHTGAKGSTTKLLEMGSERASLQSTSGDGKWQVRWDIDDRCARMTVLRVDPDDPHHWFLYEGTPGGRFAPDASRWMRSTGETGSLHDAWELALPESSWVAFSDPEGERSLFLHCRKQRRFVDMYKPMPPMTVFGFGRQLEGVESFIQDEQTVLTIGFVDEIEVDAIAAAVAAVV